MYITGFRVDFRLYFSPPPFAPEIKVISDGITKIFIMFILVNICGFVKYFFEFLEKFCFNVLAYKD